MHGGFVQMTRRPPRRAVRPRRAEGPDRRAARAAGEGRGRAGARPRPRGSRGASGAQACRDAPRGRVQRRAAAPDGERSRPAPRVAAMRRVVLLLVALVVLLVRPVVPAHAARRPSTRTAGSAPGSTSSTTRNALQPEGSPPPVTPASVDDMAALGVRTLYLQVVQPGRRVAERRSSTRRCSASSSAPRARRRDEGGGLVPPVGRRRRRRLRDDPADRRVPRRRQGLRRRRARPRGHSAAFPTSRSATTAIVDLTKRTRKLLGKSRALGAIVYPAVQTELINPALWPTFPYRRLQPSVDVWMPMAYFTFRDVESGTGTRCATPRTASRCCARTCSDRTRAVHVIGGIADLATPDDYAAFLEAARQHEGGRLLDVRLPHDVVRPRGRAVCARQRRLSRT